jgi:hypothetical protein
MTMIPYNPIRSYRLALQPIIDLEYDQELNYTFKLLVEQIMQVLNKVFPGLFSNPAHINIHIKPNIVAKAAVIIASVILCTKIAQAILRSKSRLQATQPVYGSSTLHLPTTKLFIEEMEQLVPRFNLSQRKALLQKGSHFSRHISNDTRIEILSFLNIKEIVRAREVSTDFRKSSLSAMQRQLRNIVKLEKDESLPYFYIFRRYSRIDKGINLRLSGFLSQLQSIQILSLYDLAITNEHIEQLSKKSHKITSLDLSYCHLITDRSLSIIEKSFVNLRKFNTVGCIHLTLSHFVKFSATRLSVIHLGYDSDLEGVEFNLRYSQNLSRELIKTEKFYSQDSIARDPTNLDFPYRQFISHKEQDHTTFVNEIEDGEKWLNKDPENELKCQEIRLKRLEELKAR